MNQFSVTYEIVTQESAEDNAAEKRGFICECSNLRDAIADLCATRTNEVDGIVAIESDEYPVRSPRSITVTNGMEYRTGAQESRSLHLPDGLTAASRVRIARLLGVRC